MLDFLDSRFELYEGNEVYIPQSWMAEFVAAIKGNQPQEVQRWLDKDRRLLSLNLEGNSTALHLACEFSSPELVDTLSKILKKRNKLVIQSNPGYKSVYLNVLLERALNSRDLSHCELLLSLGAELDQPEVSNQNTLFDLTPISRSPNYEHNINLKNRSLSYASKKQEESQKR